MKIRQPWDVDILDEPNPPFASLGSVGDSHRLGGSTGLLNLPVVILEVQRVLSSIHRRSGSERVPHAGLHARRRSDARSISADGKRSAGGALIAARGH